MIRLLTKQLHTNKVDRQIVRCFWIFFFLLMTEGIFRRWLLPGLSNIFLVARDPFVFYAVVIGLKKYSLNGYARTMLIIGCLSIITTLAAGHGNFVVALYGARIAALYFPFIIICSKVLTRQEVLLMGKILVCCIIPMVALNIVQFFSPQSSFVNIGVGGDEKGAGFSGGALGYFRPPGIFTFIAALTDYYACAFAFLLYFAYNNNAARAVGISKRFILYTIVAFIISLFVCISRTHFVTSMGMLATAMVVLKSNPKIVKSFIVLALIILILFAILNLIPEFRLFQEVFFTRFNGANESEGSLAESMYERSFGWLMRAVEKAPLLGYGEGMFSNFGARYLFGENAWEKLQYGYYGKVADATEMEWGRIVCEEGLILGIIHIVTRVCMAVSMIVLGYHQLSRYKDSLVWFIVVPAAMMVAIFQMKAAYNLGFMSILAISFYAIARTNRFSNKNVHK